MYTITITRLDSKLVKSFSTKEEAKKEVKRLCKELGLKRIVGFYGNAKTGTELDTNY